MFSGLGGDESWRKPSNVSQPDDEFHLGDITEAGIRESLAQSTDSLTHILERYNVDTEQLNHLEGDSKHEATRELYRRSALRDARTKTWVTEQCAGLQKEYHACLSSSYLRIPYVTCATEEQSYSHCMDLATVRTPPTTFSVFSTVTPILNLLSQLTAWFDLTYRFPSLAPRKREEEEPFRRSVSRLG